MSDLHLLVIVKRNTSLLHAAYSKDVIFHVVHDDGAFHAFELNTTIKKQRKELNLILQLIHAQEIKRDVLMHGMEGARMETGLDSFMGMGAECLRKKEPEDGRDLIEYATLCQKCYKEEWDKSMGYVTSVFDEAFVSAEYGDESAPPKSYMELMVDENLEDDIYTTARAPPGSGRSGRETRGVLQLSSSPHACARCSGIRVIR